MESIQKEAGRIEAIDVIRGFAVFGIFLVNWPSMVGVELLGSTKSYTGGDAFLRLLYDLFIQTKFYTIFSFLFGLGFFIFTENAKKKTKWPRFLFFRRLVFLFFFGSMHYILLWEGDILHTYALTGIFLLLFYNRSAKAVLIWSLALLFLFQLLIILATALAGSAVSTVHEINQMNPLQNWTAQTEKRWGNFFGGNIFQNIVYIPETLGLFLLGVFAGKIRLFHRIKEWRRQLQIVQVTSLLLTLPSWYMIIRYYIAEVVYQSAEVYVYVLLSGKTLCVFYIIMLLQLMQSSKWQLLLRPLQYTGKMAFTNYLTQTILTILLFGFFIPNSYDLPLFIGLLFCIAFYILQIFWSKWWLSRFPYGPFEYVWRVLTYGKTIKQQKIEQKS